MHRNLKWHLAAALLGVVVLLSPPGEAAKIQQSKDDQGTLHISNSEEAEPGKPQTEPKAQLNQKRHAPIFSTPPATLRAKQLQASGTPPPEQVAPPPVIAAPTTEPQHETPPVIESQPNAASTDLGSGRHGGGSRGRR